MHDISHLSAPSKPVVIGRWSSRWRALDFALRAEGLRWLRLLRDTVDRGRGLRWPATHAPTWGKILAASRSRLWTQRSADEWQLVAGKIHNLRIAATRLDGLVVKPGETFSFWQAVGAPTRRRGFVDGRELREGCLVASTGGGLCQLSNALYAVALDVGATIVERHAHSRALPGSQAEAQRDATVFWNYLDLRFRVGQTVTIEARLDSGHLSVRLRGDATSRPQLARQSQVMRAEAHDCVGCTQAQCVQHIAAVPSAGRTAVMQVLGWPEFDAWLDARRLFPSPAPREPVSARWHALAARACHHRPARRQHHLLAAGDARSAAWAARLGRDVDEVVVPVDALAMLHRLGALGGRRVTVMMTRSPLRMLHQQLDDAALPGLHEFRAPSWRVDAEGSALRQALRILTPHHAVAQFLREQGLKTVELLRWAMPSAQHSRRGPILLFPASSLARKGAFELRDACRVLELPIAVLGQATDAPEFWRGVPRVPLDEDDPWRGIAGVVLPARVEHAPRWLLQALARGLPVVATPACGLDPRTPGLRLVPPGDPVALALALYELQPSAASILALQR